MTNEERKIYDSGSQIPQCAVSAFVYEQVSMEELLLENFAASGKSCKSAGWKDVYENTDDTEGMRTLLTMHRN